MLLTAAFYCKNYNSLDWIHFSLIASSFQCQMYHLEPPWLMERMEKLSSLYFFLLQKLLCLCAYVTCRSIGFWQILKEYEGRGLKKNVVSSFLIQDSFSLGPHRPSLMKDPCPPCQHGLAVKGTTLWCFNSVSHWNPSFLGGGLVRFSSLRKIRHQG